VKLNKIALIEPEAPSEHIYSASRMPRLGLPLLGALLKNQGYHVEIFMGKRKSLPRMDLLEADLVGISTTTSTSYEAYRIATYLRNRGILVVIGGIHATFLPEEALQYANYVVRGEAESSFPALVDAIRKGRTPEGIPGVSYWTDRGMKHNAGNSCWTDVNSLPSPDLSLIQNFQKRNMRTYPVMTSRGCPHDCFFCSVTSMFGRGFRYKDNEQVLQELARYQGGNVFFVDDNFAAYNTHTKELLREMLDRKISLNWWGAQVRAEIARDDELLELMRLNKAKMVFIGFESINPETLEAYNKKQSVDDIRESIRRFHEKRIRIHGMFVLGGDGDTRETIRETVDFALKARIDTVQFLTLTPIPGTALFDQIEAEGRLLTRNWELFDGHHVVFQPKKISPEQLQEEAIKAHKRFYSFRNWWSNVFLTGWGTVLHRVVGWWIIKRWEKHNRWFGPLLQKYLGKKEPENASLVSCKVKAFKLKKLKPLKDNLMQIYLSRKDGVFHLQIRGIVNQVTLKALCREFNKAIPEKYFDLVIRTEGIKFATEKSSERFSRWLNSIGDRARQLQVVGRIEDGIHRIADIHASTIPRFELINDK
jgi:anaerobic magnesium-protoporphyrin IX monomethyl ester cyclase